MNVYEFIQYVDQNKEKFIKYCEIIITDNGIIEFAHPTHSISIVREASKKNKISVEEYKNSIPKSCSPLHWVTCKEKFIGVWYNYIIVPQKINRIQKKVLDLLSENGIIDKYYTKEISKEYENYLYRKKLGIEE